MANPTCTRDSFVAGTACFKNFNFQERASILIYLNAIELAELGGTDYTLGSGGTLEDAAQCLVNLAGNPFVSPSVYYLLVAANNATAAGATIPATQAAYAEAIACNKLFSMADLAAQMLHLACSLGVHKTFPQ